MASRAGFKRRESLRRILLALPIEERKKIQVAQSNAADAIVHTQKRLAPILKEPHSKRRPGALRQSITATRGDHDLPAYASVRSKRTVKDPELTVIITAGNSEVRYAFHVEHGTERTPAQPFFGPGFRAHKAETRSRIRKAAKDAIKSAIAKGRAGG